VMLVPFGRIAVPLAEVLFPAFARLQRDREAIAAIWVRSGRLVAALSLPALAGLAVLAPEFVDVVLGHRWHGAVTVLRILTWVGFLQSLQTLNGPILQALDRTGLLFRYSVVFFLAHLAAFVIGLRWGVAGVAGAYAISTTIVEPLYFWLTARALEVSPFAFLRGLGGVIQAVAAMSVALLLARHALVGPTGSPLRLLELVALGAAVYVPVVSWRSAELRAECRRFVPRRRVAQAPSPNV
jgi:O-antigen/teichoic acid export membrane protein